LRSNVTVRGIEGKTILKKADGVVSALAIDGDFGEEQITLVNPNGFRVGYGVAIWDQNAGGFHTTVARITGQTQNTFSISQPLMADCMIHREAIAATVYPVISGYHIENVRIENITIDGNKENNIHLNGCRGAGIFLFRGHKTEMRNCRVLNYNGDGISFQQSNDVSVKDCISEKNAELGLHPGSGSQRPHITGCQSRNNGTDGLFLCWRVRHGIFENNRLERNGRFGISIGHKDSDNLLQKNQVRKNSKDGIFFRNETLGMAGHRNRLLDNIIEDNGQSGEGAGIRIRGEVNDLLFKNNTIKQTQSVGIRIEESVGNVYLENNLIEAQTLIQDLRKNEKSS
jgi:parallel beta-helix repeat protein